MTESVTARSGQMIEVLRKRLIVLLYNVAADYAFERKFVAIKKA
ncbi:hypothetical protein [Paenibacillus alkaliterrae]|nr:hypothetical protein [Paenibacillus alkaliterrae]